MRYIAVLLSFLMLSCSEPEKVNCYLFSEDFEGWYIIINSVEGAPSISESETGLNLFNFVFSRICETSDPVMFQPSKTVYFKTTAEDSSIGTINLEGVMYAFDQRFSKEGKASSMRAIYVTRSVNKEVSLEDLSEFLRSHRPDLIDYLEPFLNGDR